MIGESEAWVVCCSQDLTRRERVKQKREGHILDAAAAVSAFKGFRRVTISETVELCGVADSTIGL